jgi:hypothetical protein
MEFVIYKMVACKIYQKQLDLNHEIDKSIYIYFCRCSFICEIVAIDYVRLLAGCGRVSARQVLYGT